MHQAVLRLEGSLVQVFEESLCRKISYAPKVLFPEAKMRKKLDGLFRGRLSSYADRVEEAFERTGTLCGAMRRETAQ